MDEDPDTLIHREDVTKWMEDHWQHGPCPVCQSDTWEAEARLFAMPRLPPFVGVFRAVFPVRCKTCSYMVLINAKSAGISLEAVFPDDLSGLPQPPEGIEG